MRLLAGLFMAVALALIAAPAYSHQHEGAAHEPSVEEQAAIFEQIPGWLRKRTAVQLYSYRNDLKQDLHGTLAKVRAIGFQYVELYPGITPNDLDTKVALDRAGLIPMAGHVSLETLRNNPEGVVAYARLMGVRRMGVPWIQSQSPFDEAQVRAAAEAYNKACPVLRRAGITPFYHIHGYEFIRHEDRTLFELLLSLVPARCMEIQADVFWVKHGGPDPAEFILDRNNRVTMLHVKDMAKDIVTPQIDGLEPDEASVALGEGQLDIAGILVAAKRRGVDWYVIEDEAPDVHAQMPRSFKFLAAMR